MTPAPILTRWHRPTGTPRTCPGCGAVRRNGASPQIGALSNWCTASVFVDGEWPKPPVRRLLEWSGALPEPTPMTTELMEAA